MEIVLFSGNPIGIYLFQKSWTNLWIILITAWILYWSLNCINPVWNYLEHVELSPEEDASWSVHGNEAIPEDPALALSPGSPLPNPESDIMVCEASKRYTHAAPCSRSTLTASNRNILWWASSTPIASRSSEPIFF